MNGFSKATVSIYRFWLNQLAEMVPDVESLDSVAMSKFITRIRARGLKPSSVHQAYRNVKTFTLWLQAKGLLPHDPLAGVDIKVPQVLLDPPTAEELQAVLDQCNPKTLVGLRNRAMILSMAESGLRRAEVIHLTVDHWNKGDKNTLPSFTVRAGKGIKDRICGAGSLTARAIKAYLDARRVYDRTDFLFVADDGKPLKGRSLVQILHRLSEKAKLPRGRWLHPHSIRHLAGTSWARAGMGMDQIRRQLGHSSMSTTMRYVNLDAKDVQEAHRQASALERMGIR